MTKTRILAVQLLLVTGFLVGPTVLYAKHHHRNYRHSHASHHHSSKGRKAALAGAGVAVGKVAGPAGSVGFGAVSYRRELRAGGPARRKAMVKIGAPVAAGAAFGPAGTVGYEVVNHRRWLKRHIIPHHRRHRAHRRYRRRA